MPRPILYAIVVMLRPSGNCNLCSLIGVAVVHRDCVLFKGALDKYNAYLFFFFFFFLLSNSI